MDITKIILDVVKEVGVDRDNQALMSAEENTRLFGNTLDSMGVVYLVSEVEERIADELNINIILADERAMSQKTSPFRSVKTLAKYVDMLVKESKDQS